MTAKQRQNFLRAWACLALFAYVAAAQAAGERLSLWEARGPHATVYLFGSIHACKASCYPLPATVLKHFDASGTLVLELDPSRIDAQAKISEAASLPPGESLVAKLSVQDGKDLRSVIGELGLPESLVFQFRPWMASTLISLAAIQQQGFNVDQGVDLWLLSRARSQGKNIVELETVDRQIAALTSGTESDQIAGLRQTVDMVKRHRIAPYFEEMIAAWQHGESAKIDALVSEDEGADKNLNIEILDRRNAEMATKIGQWLDRGNASFVVIGVAHLVGRNNVGELLARKGYVVRQLSEGE